jgi:gluconokinase
MHSGTPLNDSDRLPWLRTLANEILHWQKQNKSNVLACSALKDTYRQLLDPENKCQWVYLRGDKETIRKRMQERPGHFMPPKLLDSQFETLEEPKNALSYDILLSPEEIVENIIKDSKS